MQFSELIHPVHHVCFLQEEPINSITPLIDTSIPSHKVTFVVEKNTEEKDAIKHLLNSRGIETHFLGILSKVVEFQNDYEQLKNHLSMLKSQPGSVIINVASANKLVGHLIHRLAVELELPLMTVDTRKDRAVFIQPQFSGDIQIADKMKLPHFLSLHDGLVREQLSIHFENRDSVKTCFKSWLRDAHFLSNALSYLNNIPAIRGLGADYYASATLENILEERRKEFAFEGLRFHDLSRMGMDMPVIDSFKQSNDDLTGTPPAYGSYRYAYPIALSERNANPNMVQNYGY